MTLKAPVARAPWPMQRLSPVLVEIGTNACIRTSLRTVQGTMHARTQPIITRLGRRIGNGVGAGSPADASDSSASSPRRAVLRCHHHAPATTGITASEIG